MLLFFFILVFILGSIFLIFTRLRDARYLKGSTREALGEELKAEIEGEKSLFARHASRFQAALDKANKKRKDHP